MKHDEFFAEKNIADEHLAASRASYDACDMMVDACIRRLAGMEGHFKTAVRLQRLADICAAVDVKPIEHWRGPTVPPKSRLKRFLGLIDWNYLIGFLIGLYIGGHS